MTLPLAAILIASASAAAQPAVPAPAIEPLAEAMVQPLERKVLAITSRDGEVAVAAEFLYGKYSLQADLSTLCEELGGVDWRKSPACLVMERFDALRAGDLERYISLLEPGSEKRKELESGETESFQSAQEDLAAFHEIRPFTQVAWDQYRLVDLVAVSKDGQTDQLFVWASLEVDPPTETFWFVQEMSKLNLPIHRVRDGLRSANRFLLEAPQETTALRLKKIDRSHRERSINPESIEPSDVVDPTVLSRLKKNLRESENKRRVEAELLSPGTAKRATDLIVYVKEERFPIDAPPLAQMDPDELDEAGRSLLASLRLQRRWIDDEEVPLDQLAAMWHSGYREAMRNNYESWDQSQLKIPMRGVQESAKNLEKLRITSRTFTRNGIVWFVWYPDDAAGEGMRSLTILQLKEEAGEYKLVSSAQRVPIYGDADMDYGSDRQAMQLLGGDNMGYSGVSEALARRHRAELQAESKPDSR